MVLSDSTNYTGLIEDVVFWIAGDSSATLSDYTANDRKRNINKWYQDCVSRILNAMDSWKFHGEWATADTVEDQEEYLFPSDILKINRVEIRYDSGSNDYVVATPRDERTETRALANDDDIHSETNPIYYKPDERSLVFDPIPDESITDGIKIWYTKEVTELSSNSDEPVIVEPFHRILSIGAALDYAEANQMTEKMIALRRRLYGTEAHPENGLLFQLEKFYATKEREDSARIIPRVQRFN